MNRKELIRKAKEHIEYDIPKTTQDLLLQMAAELEKDNRRAEMVTPEQVKAECYDVITQNFTEFINLDDPERAFFDFVDGVVQTESAVMTLLFAPREESCSNE